MPKIDFYLLVIYELNKKAKTLFSGNFRGF